MAPLFRKAPSVLLLALSGCLLWYSMSTYKLSGQNRLGDFSAQFFPKARIQDGLSMELALNHAEAAEFFRKAILEGPCFIDAWMGLARACVAEGHVDEARKILKIVSPALSSISTWKWQELLLAYDLADEQYFERCLNYILSYLPDRTDKAGLLASRFWGDWDVVIPHVSRENRPVFLYTLIDQKQADAAIALFKVIESEGPQLGEKEGIRLCEFLISNDRLKEAKAAWGLIRKEDAPLIDDGSFEKSPLDMAFGWRFRSDPGVTVERAAGSPCQGNSCLHIHFKGTGNIGGGLAWQIVPVRPESSYCLSFVRKSGSLTTDCGVFLSIDGYRNGKLDIATKPALGDSPWTKEKVEFRTPAGCEAVVLHVRRNESLKLDNKISGDYWLGSVELVEKH